VWQRVETGQRDQRDVKTFLTGKVLAESGVGVSAVAVVQEPGERADIRERCVEVTGAVDVPHKPTARSRASVPLW
jgi:hypothetical protein